MSNGAPEPLTPKDCDLRDFQYMELDVRSLRDSRFSAQVSGDSFRAGVLLWCAAWHQVPAGSLPDDDIELANLAGYGRFTKEWRKVRDEALTKFVKCSDDRLYHMEVSKKALAAWNAKLHHHYDRARDRLRKANKARSAEGRDQIPEFTFEQWNDSRISKGIPMEKTEASTGIPELSKTTPAGIPPENALRGRGNGEGEGKGEGEGDLKRKEDSVADATGGMPPSDPPPDGKPPKKPSPVDGRAELWNGMKALFHAQGDTTKSAAGAFLNKLTMTYGDAIALQAMREAIQTPPGNLQSWLTARCQTIQGTRSAPNKQERLEASNRAVVEALLAEEAEQAANAGRTVDA